MNKNNIITSICNKNTKISKKKITTRMFYDIIQFNPRSKPNIEKNTKLFLNFNEYENIKIYNYRLIQLKGLAKHYKQKSTGNKQELQNILYNYLRLSYFIVKIQKNVRRMFVRKYIMLKGPAFLNRKLCNNPTDFFSLEEMNDIKYNQFISIKDIDGFIYGFDVISLYTYLKKNKKNPCNPYNRNKFSLQKNSNPLSNINSMIKLSKILNIPIKISCESEYVSYSKQLELRALSIFQEIDSLGNYTDSSWLLSLNNNQLITFIHELYDLWTYRLQLDHITKISISPPLGNPFTNINMHNISNGLTLNELKTTSMSIIERFIKSGISEQFKSLGAQYVLTALTIVSNNAAIALPWLYQSVVY